jgi:hypothetical protein
VVALGAMTNFVQDDGACRMAGLVWSGLAMVVVVLECRRASFDSFDLALYSPGS